MTTLSKDIKSGTKKSHSAAENTKFIAAFLRGVISEENYRTLIKDLYFVYAAIEQEMERLKDDKYIAPINFKELNRIEQLKMDVRYYYGPNWRSLIAPSESAVQYVERVHEVADKDPYLLVGHHYTRYMGDLSGGQILAGIAENALNLREGEGLKFYDFDKIDDKKAYKDKYRFALDCLPLDKPKMDAIIAEANYAFKLNMDLFDELGGDSKDGWKAFFKILKGFLTRS